MNIKEIQPCSDKNFLCLVTKGEPSETFCKSGYENIEVTPVYDDNSYFRIGDKVAEFLYDCNNKNRPVRIRSGVVHAVHTDGQIQLLIDSI